MKNKLKELSRYCCKPANKSEYEFIKLCASYGGVEFSTIASEKYEPKKYPYIFFSTNENVLLSCSYKQNLQLIPVTQFCDIMLKAESEFDWKPKVGEWCAREWKNGDVDVFEIEEIHEDGFKVSKITRNGLKNKITFIFIKSNEFILRQPTPEEIQTAIDAWDDRVYVMDNSWLVDNGKELCACDGYKFRLSEDCQTVEMVEDTKCGFCVKPKNEER